MTLQWHDVQTRVPGWRVVLGRLHLSVRFDDFAAGLGFVNAVGEIAERLDHHPEIDLRYGFVHLALSSHDVGGLTERDVELANEVSAVVAEHGGRLAHGETSEFELVIDTLDAEAIRPFWRAALGYVDAADGALTDPRRVGPLVWFQTMDEPRTERNRVHLDISVAHDEADARIAAAVAAGGQVLHDARSPAFVTLADADGNEVCICTWQSRPPV